ncbi:MAG: hypothetical protein ABI399_03750 [Bauldia sp.]
MREMLVPIFGESGAVVAQFVLTLVAVLILVGAVVWAVRRYGTGAFAAVARNRVPRLALVDALPIDGRRRLILIRRDHVEHLILIGGPTDLVVEPTIVRGVSVGARPRQGQPARQAAQPNGAPQATAGMPPAEVPPPESEPVQAPPRPSILMRPAPAPTPRETSSPVPMPAAAARPAPAPPPPPPPSPRRLPPAAGAEPIPFPQPQRVPEPDADLPPPSLLRRPATAATTRPASGHFVETARPTRIESVFALADALDDIADGPEASPAAPFEPARAAAPPALPPSAAAPAEADDEPLPEYLSLANDEPAPATAAEEIAEGPPPGDGSASRVSDLEREMARLLGEITARRGG